MSKCGICRGSKWFAWTIVLGSLLLLPGTVMSQEVADAPATDAATTETATAESGTTTSDVPPAETDTPTTESPTATTQPTADSPPPTPPAEAAPTDTAKTDAAPANSSNEAAPTGTAAATSPTATAAPATASDTFQLVLKGAGLILALFVMPILLGNFLATQWRMPDHAWKFSVVLFAIASSTIILFNAVKYDEFKYGPDLAGGITLVYELADNSRPVPQNGQAPSSADAGTDGKAEDQGSSAASRGPDFTMDQLVTALKERIDPTGTREVTIREYGQAVEIIIPKQGQDELDYVKRRITDLGQLEFRITASNIYNDDQPKIKLALAAPPSQKFILDNGSPVAEWVGYSEKEFGAVDDPGNRGIVKRLAGDVPEALVLIDPFNVTGDDLTSQSKGIDQRGGPAVNFTFDSDGSYKFGQLTNQNKPNPATGAERNLGIILDKRLISAPSIREKISNNGQISGGAMSEDEVDYIVGILKAGRLPAALEKSPISEEIISPTLGAVTVEKGEQAIIASMVVVVLFMLVYYRFAGFVACLALTFNIVLVLALMVLIKAAFTLPGLAGLVLTIGMAVDANILIYERIREELKSGTALRMAIRNGFSRAMSAIIDSNVTTIISGIALYAIGTDQVKGFAVTLILGLLTSMFTAIFFARVIFDVAERRGWIKNLTMMKILAQPNYDFLKMRWPAIWASLIVIAIGMVAAGMRGQTMFDIDFTGGSSVTFTFKESAKMPISAVRDALIATELNDKNLLVVARGESDTRYSIDTSEQSVDKVKEILGSTFGDKLLSSTVEIKDVKPFTEGEFSGTEATVVVNDAPGYSDDDGVGYDALRERIQIALIAAGHPTIQPTVSNPLYRAGSAARFQDWTVRLTGLDLAAAQPIFEQVKKEMEGTPLFPMANKIGGRVSSDMKSRALIAIIVSLLGVIAYLWLRFQKASYGVAAAVAVAHDVLVTIGMMGLSAYVVNAVPALAQALQLDAFQISLTIVAALLTIIGYSLNDTIVTFDRLREIKGKSPHLTADMVNAAVNQCLSRTILTALTVFLTVVILYFFGGEGIHSFAFAFLVGVVAGTYSTVYIAAPVLLWLSGQRIEAAK